MSSNEEDNHLNLSFESSDHTIKALIEFFDIDVSKLTNEEKAVLENILAGFATMLAGTIESKNEFRLGGLNVASAFIVILQKLSEANATVASMSTPGHNKLN